MSMDSAHPHFQHGDALGQCTAPVPSSVFDPSVDLSNGYHVAEINDGIYWVTDGTYQMMFATTGVGVIVVDAPPSIGGNILNAISDVTSEPITHVIYTHSHADHIAGAGVLPTSATFISHQSVAETLTRNGADDTIKFPPFGLFIGGGPVPLPTLTFTGTYTLTVGDKTLELMEITPNHEEGNIVVFAPDQKVAMLVDVIFPGWSPFKSLALAKDVPGFIQAHDDLLALDWDTLVGGHVTRLGTKADVITQRDYVMDIRGNAITALATTDFLGIAQQTGFTNQWLLFDTYLNSVAQKCADLTEPAWVDRLGGVDVFTISHCHAMAESLRID
ncbi:MAG: MBL fold metallo-hydrolase [Chloroflexi bacterium]|nr:MBL fold metallo-hydrolase [Chloroflexota bacterium]MDA1227008.1 MBL fold metallo-hydrolase [Chloroflexota bacterium]